MTPERLRHTLLGERDGRASGWHHRPGGIDPPGAKLLKVTRRDTRTGVYNGRVAFQNRRTGAWREKRGGSTFFPDDWTPAQVDNAVNRGFNSPDVVKDPETGRWSSIFRNVELEGFYDPDTDTLRHGYPVLRHPGGTP
ncbi:EndoU domain-containing protein [Micromonospora sp. WMMD961]|uniref:EndoU domain-containing protein n=1 Tax=Micromonospora sp. WMMD961 TaxID=3016100 RepID=UPI0024171BC3|nr:EndoU domain-containing protein [Micromonospora sp. WMMD961]MDG4778216.1 EndoU domain-containing protein [Micromonospora sp. WMMD961]